MLAPHTANVNHSLLRVRVLSIELDLAHGITAPCAARVAVRVVGDFKYLLVGAMEAELGLFPSWLTI